MFIEVNKENSKLSIMTVFSNVASKIYDNEYIFEFSKKGLKNPTHKMYLYEKAPVKMITGYIEISHIGLFEIETLYAENKNYFDNVDTDFMAKNKDLSQINVYKISKSVRFENPVTLQKLGKKSAPQSIQYVESDYEI